MGSVYSIHSQMKFKDKDKAIKILQAKISRGEEEHTDYGLDTYRKSENLDINDIDDLIAVADCRNPRLTVPADHHLVDIAHQKLKQKLRKNRQAHPKDPPRVKFFHQRASSMEKGWCS